MYCKTEGGITKREEEACFEHVTKSYLTNHRQSLVFGKYLSSRDYTAFLSKQTLLKFPLTAAKFEIPG